MRYNYIIYLRAIIIYKRAILFIKGLYVYISGLYIYNGAGTAFLRPVRRVNGF